LRAIRAFVCIQGVINSRAPYSTNFLVIDPEECIDCSLCEPECPVDAIYAEDDLPENQSQFLELNAELSQTWPVITEQQPHFPDAKDWEGVENKFEHLEK